MSLSGQSITGTSAGISRCARRAAIILHLAVLMNRRLELIWQGRS